jgi:hypothetical protein
MTLQRIQFKDLKGTEGLVFLGCGGDLDEWGNGIKLMLPADCQGIFGEFSLLISSGCRHDLVLPFLEGQDTPMSLIAWRVHFGDCSWISDYRVNYRDHHHLHPYIQSNENLDAPVEVQESVAVIDGDKDDDEVEVEIEIEVDEAENKHATTTKTTATKRTLRPQNSQSPNIPARRPKRRLFVQE